MKNNATDKSKEVVMEEEEETLFGHKSYRYRLYPTPEVAHILKQHGGTVRFVWNKMVAFANDFNKSHGKFPGRQKIQQEIVKIKQVHEFIQDAHSQPVQIVARNLTQAIQDAFDPVTAKERNVLIAKAKKENNEKALAKAQQYGYPNFKKKSLSQDNLFYPQNFKIRKSRIFFAKIGWISYIKHREMEGTPKFLTIIQDGDQWYVSITCEVKMPKVEKKPLEEANIVGMDAGLKDFLVLSDGTTIANPRTLKKNLKQLKRESRKLSKKERKETGKVSQSGKPITQYSKNGEKQSNKVNRLHRRIRNIRKDFLHKTTHRLITKYDGFALETLDIQRMMQKNSTAINRAIADVAWGTFFNLLEYKSEWYNKYFTQIDQYFPSTKKCYACGNLKEMELKDRQYVCPVCGAVQPRDHNSSWNIKDEGIRILVLEEKKEKEEILKNTVGTTGIKACGSAPVGAGKKQEKYGQLQH